MLGGLRMLDELRTDQCMRVSIKHEGIIMDVDTNAHANSADRFHESYQLCSCSPRGLASLQLKLILVSRAESFWYHGLQLSLDPRLGLFRSGFWLWRIAGLAPRRHLHVITLLLGEIA